MRFSRRAPTSAWLNNSPRSADAMPFSTSPINHSSWSTKRSMASRASSSTSLHARRQCGSVWLARQDSGGLPWLFKSKDYIVSGGRPGLPGRKDESQGYPLIDVHEMELKRQRERTCRYEVNP